MAGDWIKMRPSLLTSPKVNGMARMLEACPLAGKALSTGYNGALRDIVTRSVMRHVTVASLLVVWGAANEHTRDGIFTNADLSDIDDMTGIPGFGKAMESVGWAEYDEESNSVILPNFSEYNTSGEVRSANAKSAAQRQREYRERLRERETVTGSDVTRDVTRNRREEKRREEKNISPNGDMGNKPKTKRFIPPTLAELTTEFTGRVLHPEHEAQKFLAHYESNGWKVGKNPMKSWKAAVAGWATRSNENANSNRPDQHSHQQDDSTVGRASAAAQRKRQQILEKYGLDDAGRYGLDGTGDGGAVGQDGSLVRGEVVEAVR